MANMYPNSPEMQEPSTGTGLTSIAPPAYVPPPDPLTAAGEALFPSMVKKPPPPNFHASTPHSVREMRDADTARQIFSPQLTYKEAIPDNIFDSMAAPLPDGGANTPQRRPAMVREMRETIADLGMSEPEARRLFTAFRENVAKPLSDEAYAAQREESLKLMREKYGEDADNVMQLAQKLVNRDPRIGRFFKAGRLGNSPQVVLNMAELALREYRKGRL